MVPGRLLNMLFYTITQLFAGFYKNASFYLTPISGFSSYYGISSKNLAFPEFV
jgi:hypothetical protein